MEGREGNSTLFVGVQLARDAALRAGAAEPECGAHSDGERSGYGELREPASSGRGGRRAGRTEQTALCREHRNLSPGSPRPGSWPPAPL